MTVFDGHAMRDEIVSSMLDGQADLETSKYLDRLVELSLLEEAEHQFLIDPFDRSVALVFQLFQSSDLDPWDVNLTSFLEMFEERIKTTDRRRNRTVPRSCCRSRSSPSNRASSPSICSGPLRHQHHGTS